MPLPDPIQVQRWVDRLKGGDRGAFRPLVDAFQGPLFGYLARFTGDRHAAEDLFQEVFLKVHQEIAGQTATGSFSGWVYSLAHNLAVDWLRRRGREELTATVPETPAGRLEGELALPGADPTRLAEAVRQLPEPQRAVVCLRVYGELSFAQIARILDAPLNTVLGRMRLATVALRRALTPGWMEARV
ncbi:MAG: sigma-70 family RNA polymerase sigma factor [Candidatus Riflebacteria bacterium]|nr:sigma-70 family RNA polymerase sigma factor [Candidatus Riflebacteria bacterium]